MIDNRYASRKFILAATSLLTADGLLIAGLIDQETWKDFSITVLLLYTAGNVGTYLVSTRD